MYANDTGDQQRVHTLGSDRIILSSATAKSTARLSCLVGVLYDISEEKIC